MNRYQWKSLRSVLRIRSQLFLQYRMAALAGVITQFFFGFVMIMMYEAFFESPATRVQMPMSLAQTISYIWLGQALLGLLPWNGDREVQGMIRQGDFAYELLRPISLYRLWYYRILAQRLAPTVMKAMPLLLVVLFVLPDPYRLQGPTTFLGFLCFAITLSCSILLGCTISMVTTISALFLIGDGMDRFLPAVVMLFSGMVIPLAFFPEGLQGLFRWLPFSGLVDTPYRFYLGLYSPRELPFFLLLQVGWTIVLMVLGNVMIKKASRRTIIQGG